MRAVWKIMLGGAIEEALLAVDLYNQPRQPRRLEGFLVHMHLAWLYLLHAEFKKDGVDYRYRLPNGWFERVDGEPKTWDLQKCVSTRWPQETPERKNLELTIGLRNKVEHRYHEAVATVTAGYAQALLLNFEEELTSHFGQSNSLGELLRFPIFVGSLTPLGQAQIKQLTSQLPKDTRDFIARFESGLDDSITMDHRYAFRVTLVPKLGAKTEADAAMHFVREDELSSQEKALLEGLGKSGRVIVREQTRPVASAGLYRPATAAKRIEAKVSFKVRIHHVVRAWKKLGCRPPSNSKTPERTIEKYCIYDEPHKDYLFTPAFIDKVAREMSTATKFEAFTGITPEAK